MVQELESRPSLDSVRPDSAPCGSNADSCVGGPAAQVHPRPVLFALAAVAVVLLAFLAVWPSVYGQYSQVWDDTVFFDNDLLKKQPVGQSVWGILTGEFYDERAYYPVSQLSLALDAIYVNRPFFTRLINIAIHALNALLVWIVLLRILQNAGVLTPGARLLAATAGALLFGVHPMNVEPAAWVSGRKVELALFFALLGFYFLLRSTRWFVHGAACLCFGLALLSNALILSAPLVLAAYWVLIERRRFVHAFVLATPLLLLAAFSGGSRMVRKTSATDVIGNTESYSYQTASFLRAQWFQTSDLFYPMHLLAVYPRHRLPAWTPETSLGIALVLASLAAGIVLARRRSALARVGALGLAWYWIGLVPTYGHHHAQACRHMYFPAIGVFMICGTSLAWALGQPLVRPVLKRALLLLTGGLLASFLFLSMEEARRWNNDLDLFGYAVAEDRLEVNDLAHLNYGYALAEIEDRREEAIAHFKKSRLAHPGEPANYYNLGYNLVKLNRPAEAVSYLKYAVFLDPTDYDSHCWLGNAYTQLAQTDLAVECFQKALAIKPDLTGALSGLGSIFFDQGRMAEAVDLFRRAAASDPKSEVVVLNLALALSEKGDHQEAVEAFRRAIALSPNNAQSRIGLGYSLAELGRADEARSAFSVARRLDGDESEIEFGLGILAQTVGNRKEARDLYLSAQRQAQLSGHVLLARKVSKRLATLEASQAK